MPDSPSSCPQCEASLTAEDWNKGICYHCDGILPPQVNTHGGFTPKLEEQENGKDSRKER